MSKGLDKEQALLISGLCSSDASDCPELSEWQEIPMQLQDWIQGQDGLKIDRKCVESTKDLQMVHRLLCRKQSSITIHQSGIMSVALDVAIRVYKQVECIGREKSRIADLVVDGKSPYDVLPRKCGLCEHSR